MANEKRLIDTNALIDWLTKHTGFRGNCENCTDIDCLDCIVENCVKNFPTVDAVEVVRCKDCKHWDEYRIGSLEGPGTGDGCCLADPNNWIDHRMADDFCSYGERRTDDGRQI